MRFLHFQLSSVSRSTGASAVATAAYDARESLTCERTGRTWSYDQREDLVSKGIMVPDRAETVNWLHDREQLWNSVERFEDEWATQKYRRNTEVVSAWRAAHPNAETEGQIALPSLLPNGKPMLPGAEKSWVRQQLRDVIGPRFEGSGLAIDAGVVDAQDGSRVLAWRAMSHAEKHFDTARTAVRVIAAVPNELSDDQAAEMVEGWARDRWVRHGFVVDWAIHRTAGNTHAHFKVSPRPIQADGTWGEKKETSATDAAGLREARQSWANSANAALKAIGVDERIEWRSYEAMGSGYEPTVHEGPYARKLAVDGGKSRAVQHNAMVRARNAERTLLDPGKAVDDLAGRKAVFSRGDVEAALWRRVGGDIEAYLGSVERVWLDERLVALPGGDGEDGGLFTTARWQQTERAIFAEAGTLAGRAGWHAVAPDSVEVLFGDGGRYSHFSEAQRAAVRHVTGEDDLAIVVGRSGVGKTTLIGAAREAWEASGYRVRGLCFTGKAAAELRESAGLSLSETISHRDLAEERLPDLRRRLTQAKSPSALARARDAVLRAEDEQIGNRDIVLVDEAGMVNGEDKRRVFELCRARGAKVVLVGDPEQLAPIGAGAGIFYGLIQAHSAVYVEDVRRQILDKRDANPAWMREASEAFARGDAPAAVGAYARRGRVSVVEPVEGVASIVSAYLADRAADRKAGRRATALALAFTNDDVAAINKGVRDTLAVKGELQGPGLRVGQAVYQAGDRLAFLANENHGRVVTNLDPADRERGVRNGQLGTVEAVVKGRMTVLLDGAGARRVTVPSSFDKVAHGYAVTIHRSQSATVDRTYLLATGTHTPGAQIPRSDLDLPLAYVGCTRHRASLTIVARRSGSIRTAEDLGRAFARREDSILAREVERAGEHRDVFERVWGYRMLSSRLAEAAGRLRSANASDDDKDWFRSDAYRADYLPLRVQRRGAARALLALYDGEPGASRDALRTFAAKAGLSRGRLVMDSEARERPPFAIEADARRLAKEYVTLADAAAASLSRIKSSAPKGQAERHPDFPAYEAQQQRRDAAAAALFGTEKGIGRLALRAVDKNADWAAVASRAKTHIQRETREGFEAGGRRIAAGIHATGSLYAKMRDERRGLGPVEEHADFPAYIARRAQDDRALIEFAGRGDTALAALAAGFASAYARRRSDATPEQLVQAALTNATEREAGRVGWASFEALARENPAKAARFATRLMTEVEARPPMYRMGIAEAGQFREIEAAATAARRAAVEARAASAARRESASTTLKNVAARTILPPVRGQTRVQVQTPVLVQKPV